MNKHQTGFTLIELMIAIVLGLLIIAAGLMVFLTGQRSMGMQVGLSDVQQSSNFGLGTMAYDLRHTNLNMPSNQVINKIVTGSGVVFSANNFATENTLTNVDNYLTKESVGVDATTGKSDQLVIQFIPEYQEIKSEIEISKDGALVPAIQVNAVARNNDCEGNAINFASNNGGEASAAVVAEKPIIVYKYYLDELPGEQQIAGENTRYGLYCDAGYYFPGDTTIEGMGDGEQLIIQNVDAFKVRFGLKNTEGNFRYADIKTYVDDEEDSVNVVSIEVGLLMRSSQSIGADASLNTRNTFNIAGHTVTLKPNPANSKYLRQEVNQVVGFRNTLGGS